MVGVFVDDDDADAAGLALAAEGIGESGAAGTEDHAGKRLAGGRGGKAGIQIGRVGVAGKSAERTGKLIDGERAIILHAFVAGNFENDAVVINSEAGANDGVAFAEGIVGKTDARAEIFLVGMTMEIDDVGQPDAGAGGLRGEIRARAVIAAGAGGVGIEIPAEAEVDGEVVGDAPIVLQRRRRCSCWKYWEWERVERARRF